MTTCVTNIAVIGGWQAKALIPMFWVLDQSFYWQTLTLHWHEPFCLKVSSAKNHALLKNWDTPDIPEFANILFKGTFRLDIISGKTVLENFSIWLRNSSYYGNHASWAKMHLNLAESQQNILTHLITHHLLFVNVVMVLSENTFYNIKI